MADVVVTAANVILSSQTGIQNKTVQRTASVAITAGQAYYLDSNGLAALGDANASSASAATQGIALAAALAGQPFLGIEGGALAFGAVLTKGLVYVQSATPGGIAPAGDLASGWFSTYLGTAFSTSVLIIPPTGPIVSGVALT